MEAKHFWASKTLWLNVLGIAVIVVQTIQGEVWINPEIQILILAVLNAVMRFLTSQPIGK